MYLLIHKEIEKSSSKNPVGPKKKRRQKPRPREEES
jgi:hypothetical protein